MLVGIVFTFPSGLDLNPYPVLRRTLTQLQPALEFYLNVANLSSKTSMDSSALYETGDEKTTTQYLVLGTREQPALLQASVTIDPYVRLFSPYRREFLERLRHPSGQKPGQQLDSQGAEDKEPFLSLQQFARGQTAQLSYCGTQNYDTAATAYQKAIASGFTNKVWLAEAHHKLGLAWEGKGEHEKAKAEMLQSLTIRPNTPEILNNLGTVYRSWETRRTHSPHSKKPSRSAPTMPLPATTWLRPTSPRILNGPSRSTRPTSRWSKVSPMKPVASLSSSNASRR